MNSRRTEGSQKTQRRVSDSGTLFCITGNFVPCYTKTLRGDRTGLERNTAASQPRRRRRILRGRILCPSTGNRSGKHLFYGAVDRLIFWAMAAAVLLFVLWPLLCIAAESLWADGGLTFSAYKNLFQENASLIRHSVFTGTLAALFSTVLGIAVALRIVTLQGRVKLVLMGILLMTMVSPPFISSLVYIQLFGKRGWITYRLLGLMISPYNKWGIIAMQSLHFASLNALFAVGILEKIDHRILAASRDLGASAADTMKQIVFPMLKPAAGICFILSFIRSVSDFGTPAVIGGRYNTLASAIYLELIGYADLEKASAMNMLLLLPAVAAFLLYRLLMRKSDRLTAADSQKNSRSGLPLPLTGIVGAAVRLMSAMFFLMMTLQYICIFLTGFLKSKKGVYYFSLDNFNSLLSYNMESLTRSIQYSLIAAVAGTAFAILFAYYLERRKVRFRGFFDFISTMPYLLPGTCFGIGYILAFNSGILKMTGTAAIIIINMIFKQLPMVTKLTAASLAQLNSRVEDAARDLGAGRFHVTKDIVLPNLRRTFVTGFIYNFSSSMTTVGAVVFLISARHKLAVYTLFDAINSGEYGVASLISSLIILTTIAVTGGVSALLLREERGDGSSGRKKRKRKKGEVKQAPGQGEV